MTAATKKHRNWLWFLMLPVGFFLLGYSGAMEYLGKQATIFFKLYAEAELQKLNAVDNVNSSGEHEYVVAMENHVSNVQGSEMLMAHAGITDIRDTDFGGWYVISVDPNSLDLLSTLRGAPQVRFLFANRGVWICH